MKITSDPNERGSVLVTALITITILTLICATSLYVASQNTNAGMQTASWQQALSGAESAADLAFNALNNASASGSAWRG
jgi:Tfp pilus assembly protein PilX